MGPLGGVRVLEFAGLGPCPLAGQLLSDMGAQVTVIDRVAGLDLSTEINRRGKRSIALDLKKEGSRQTVLSLAANSDILLEGFRPGVMERFGLGPDIVLQENPAIIYGRMTGWGQEGPLHARAGHDLTYLALTGALHAIGEAGRPPVPPLNLIGDYGGGTMFLITGVLAGLVEQRQSGKGQVVDAAMVDGVPAMMGLIHSMIHRELWDTEREANLLDGGAPFYRCYETLDHRFVAVGALEPQFFAELVEVLGLDPEWTSKRNDRKNWPELHGILAGIFLQRNRDDWATIFIDRDACVAPVLDWREARDHPHAKARDAYKVSAGVAQAAPAPRFSRTPAKLPDMSGTSGAEADEILAEIGITTTEIESMRSRGIVL